MLLKIEKDKLMIDSASNGKFYVGLNALSTCFHFGNFATMEDLDCFLELLNSESSQISEGTKDDSQRLVRETHSKACLKIYGDAKKMMHSKNLIKMITMPLQCRNL